MMTTLNNFYPLTKRRSKRLKRLSKKKKLKLKERTWIAGRLITFVSIDIFGKEHRFLVQMKKCYNDLRKHRCAQCRIINHYRLCMDIRGEMCKKCMKKSDLSCYPQKLRVLK